MIDIKCKNNVCPICGREMEVIKDNHPIYETISKACYNTCYKIRMTRNTILNELDISYIKIFGEQILFFHYIQNLGVNAKEVVAEKIKYWKKKERYLTKLLER